MILKHSLSRRVLLRIMMWSNLNNILRFPQFMRRNLDSIIRFPHPIHLHRLINTSSTWLPLQDIIFTWSLSKTRRWKNNRMSITLLRRLRVNISMRTNMRFNIIKILSTFTNNTYLHTKLPPHSSRRTQSFPNNLINNTFNHSIISPSEFNNPSISNRWYYWLFSSC